MPPEDWRSLNNLIRATDRLGRGYSFEALRAKMLCSGPKGSPKRVGACSDGDVQLYPTLWRTREPA